MKYIATFFPFRLMQDCVISITPLIYSNNRIEPVPALGEVSYDVTDYVTSAVHEQDLPWFMAGGIDNSNLKRLHATPVWIQEWLGAYMIIVRGEPE